MDPVTVGLLALAALGAWVWSRSSSPSAGPDAVSGGPARRDDVAGLVPELREKWARIDRRLRARGFEPWVYETVRSQARQAHLARTDATGRTPSRVGAHGEGRALDVIDGRPRPGGKPGERVGWGTWGDAQSRAMAEQFFDALGEEAEREGLTWGGRWTSTYGARGDAPHIQLGPSRSTAVT